MRSLRIRYSSNSNSRWVSSIWRSPRSDFVRVGVQRQVADAQRRRSARRAAAQQRAHPREQLLALERLDQVVVGARVEARRRATRARPGRSGSGSARRRRYAASAQPRGRRSRAARGRGSRGRARTSACAPAPRGRRGQAHLVSLHAQRALQCLGDVLVVLDDQYAWCAGKLVHRLYLVAVGAKAMVSLAGRFTPVGVEVAPDGHKAQARLAALASRASSAYAAGRAARRQGAVRRAAGACRAARLALSGIRALRVCRLYQRGRDVLGMGLLAAGAFMSFVLYGGWNGGRAGCALAVALGWMLGPGARPHAARAGGRGRLASARSAACAARRRHGVRRARVDGRRATRPAPGWRACSHP